MGRSVESRLEKLEEITPRVYTTYDTQGRPVIQSDLPALEWMRGATALLQARGRGAAKAALRAQLARSAGPDGDRGYLYQLVAVSDPEAIVPTGGKK
jgi:hypothetical protein